MLDLHPGDELVGRIFIEFLGFFDPQFFESSQTHLQAGGPGVETLETEHQRGPLMDQHHPPAQQIAYRPQVGIVNVAGRQNIQPQQLRQEEGVISVVSMLESAVLFDACRIG